MLFLKSLAICYISQVQNRSQQMNDQAVVRSSHNSFFRFLYTSIFQILFLGWWFYYLHVKTFFQVRCEYSMANFSTGDRMRKPKGDRFIYFSLSSFSLYFFMWLLLIDLVCLISVSRNGLISNFPCLQIFVLYRLSHCFSYNYPVSYRLQN